MPPREESISAEREGRPPRVRELHAASDPAACCREIATLLRAGDLHGALRRVNERTRYRFTGLYRCQPPRLRNVLLFDRENPTTRLGGDVCMLSETYCSIVAGASRPFHTDDASGDPLLLHHPARSSVVSYLGVAVHDASGAVWGTLCHFDVRPRMAPARELPVMEWTARAITEHTAIVTAD